jgi:hypothetical protein
MVSLHIDACSLVNDDLIFSDEAGAGHVNDDLITYDEAGVEQALIRLSRSCLDETVLDDDDAAGQALIRLSRSCLDETVLDDDDARCVFFVFFIITEHTKKVSHSHVVYPQLSVYVLMFVHVVKLSAHLPLWRKLWR